MLYIGVNSDNRICAISNYHCGPNEAEIAEFPENFEVEDAFSWKYVNGEFTYDPLPAVEDKSECDELREELAQVTATNDMLTECILEMSEIVYGE